MDGALTTLLLVAMLSAAALIAAGIFRRGGRKVRTKHATAAAQLDRRRLAHLLQDDIGQKFAAARVNLSALRLQLRTGGLPETAELDAALNLLDDGCRDLRTVSRLMTADEKISPAKDAS
jgi:signal transduction histidine kinase